MKLVEFCDVGFGYRRSQAVIRSFSWNVSPGRTVLLGPNGAGKTTLLALAADVLQPHSGNITVGNVRASRSRAEYRRLVGWMPQRVDAVPGLRAREQVAYAGWLKGLTRSASWSRAGHALALVGMLEHADRAASELSGGQLRRVGLAQALVHDAQVLLLDEPTVGLDPSQRARFREVLDSLPSELPILVSTHQVDDLSDIFDTVAVLVNGELHFEGTVDEFLTLAPAGSPRAGEAAYAHLVHPT